MAEPSAPRITALIETGNSTRYRLAWLAADDTGSPVGSAFLRPAATRRSMIFLP